MKTKPKPITVLKRLEALEKRMAILERVLNAKELWEMINKTPIV